jgi:hypothetical protein
MNNGIVGNTGDLQTKRFYHGTRAELTPGDLIGPSNSQDVGEGNDDANNNCLDRSGGSQDIAD